MCRQELAVVLPIMLQVQGVITLLQSVSPRVVHVCDPDSSECNYMQSLALFVACVGGFQIVLGMVILVQTRSVLRYNGIAACVAFFAVTPALLQWYFLKYAEMFVSTSNVLSVGYILSLLCQLGCYVRLLQIPVPHQQ